MKKITFILCLVLTLSLAAGCRQKVPAWDIHSNSTFCPEIHADAPIQLVPLNEQEPMEEQIQTVSAEDANTITAVLNQPFTEDDGCWCYGDVWIRVGEETFMYHYSGSITVFGYNEEHSGTLHLTEEETAQVTALIQRYLPK